MKKVSLLYSVLLVFLASCGAMLPTYSTTAVPAASSSPLPARFLNVTNTPTVTGAATVTVTLTSEPTAVATLAQPNLQEAQIQYIYLKEETSGWAWATDRSTMNYLLHTSDGGLPVPQHRRRRHLDVHKPAYAGGGWIPL
jgi:hypothetical protein